ncbi:hypothetical protein AB835_09195 [Candidatus Endobugula sertula]|uniref:Uncharacterized protein n=1 Tax=Candidatus Endobugula sertula TaxID=62101 RepID=A0A1D2QP74_9GAMM|nr:hypothetical protein AB835_09195 [Candidatus Endobugula sertula]
MLTRSQSFIAICLGFVVYFVDFLDHKNFLIRMDYMIDFKGALYPREVILHAIFFYVGYGVLYRDLEKIFE